MAAPVTIHLLLNEKGRGRLQPYMDKTGARDVSTFAMEAINLDFETRGLRDFCDNAWVGQDEKIRGNIHRTTITFTGKMAGIVRAQKNIDKSPKWLNDILSYYMAFLDQRQMSSTLTAAACTPQ